MITYIDSVEGVNAEHLHGFFEDWPNPPSPAMHLRLLANSDHVVLALDEETDRVVGFVTAISDGVLSAYVSFLEVVPEYRGRGVGQKLLQRMLANFGGLYAVGVLCDPQLEPFYARCGMVPAFGMVVHNYERQSGPE